MLYLYVKIHRVTGLKYFGKTTSKDPFLYKGSGKYWQHHLNKHGYDVDTIIIKEYECECEEAKDFAIQYSIDNNIVESAEWANLKIECLDGGWDYVNSFPNHIKKEWKRNWRESLTEDELSIINNKKSLPGELNGMYGSNRSGDKNPMYGKQHTNETKNKISAKHKNKIVVKDSITGEVMGFFDKNDPRILSGQWVSVNKGRKASLETKAKMSKIRKERGIKPPSLKGMLWWNNGQIQLRSKECPGEDFVRGRLAFKTNI